MTVFACNPCECGGNDDCPDCDPCPSCGMGEAGTWDTHFDRSICACGSMHTYCNECGTVVDGCPYDGRLTESGEPELAGTPVGGPKPLSVSPCPCEGGDGCVCQ